MTPRAPWPAYTDELLAWVRENAPNRAPVEIHVGEEALRVLRHAIGGKPVPLPGTPGGVSRAVLMMTGLPLVLRKDNWPPNLVSVIDRNGRCRLATTINEIGEEDE